eukprot:TRINITY_DN79679_c0_g1_i1.p1 TRINITY_DN79679_c0_g1~~TRINITY_DN79679_c0_g1_i1.p1  ORF type:complete len:465 (+),score=96.31 TRINITY_DN79679_c0_g1_i1:143-1537(+)
MRGNNKIDMAEISFFELERLFQQSHRALKRRNARRKRKAKQEGDLSSSDRSRSPPRRGQLRIGGRNVPATGGFTSKVEKLERVIMITNVPISIDELGIFRHFSKCGRIADMQLVRDRKGERTGVAVIEFEQESFAERACTLPEDFLQIAGQTVKIARGDAQVPKRETKPQQLQNMPGMRGVVPPPPAPQKMSFTQQVLANLKKEDSVAPNLRRLHIKNLRPVVRDEDMKGIFKPFGEFEDFKMGICECWITFKSHTDAQDAMSSMQGFQLVGQELQIKMEPVAKEQQKESEILDLKADTDFGANMAGGGMHSRIQLMKKLMASHSQQGVPTVVGLAAPTASAPPVAAATPVAPLPPAPKPGSPSCRTLLLQNMFSNSSVDLKTEPKFYDEIRDDTYQECSKFGKVVHCTVDPRGSVGLIYVLYETPQQRVSGEMALNGRWFEGKKIIAQAIDDSIWTDLAAQSQ